MKKVASARAVWSSGGGAPCSLIQDGWSLTVAAAGESIIPAQSFPKAARLRGLPWTGGRRTSVMSLQRVNINALLCITVLSQTSTRSDGRAHSRSVFPSRPYLRSDIRSVAFLTCRPGINLISLFCQVLQSAPDITSGCVASKCRGSL